MAHFLCIRSQSDIEGGSKGQTTVSTRLYKSIDNYKGLTYYKNID
jgi:hypothetical protein